MSPRGTALAAIGLGLAAIGVSVASWDRDPPRATQAVVASVTDGDTLVLEGGDRVRIVGIDAPELRGGFDTGPDCGAEEARDLVTDLVLGDEVTLIRPNDVYPDEDRYGRLLRYVDTNLNVDVGSELIERGLADAMYDSKDGYDYHPRESGYHILDLIHEDDCDRPRSGYEPYYDTCSEAPGPLGRGDPGYRPPLDRDSDGVACED